MTTLTAFVLDAAAIAAKDYAHYEEVQAALASRQGEIRAKESSIADHVDALRALNVLSDATAGAILGGLEALISEGLAAVFGRELQFSIVQSTVNKAPHLSFSLSDGGMTTDLVGARGGGVVAVVGLLLRLVVARLVGVRLLLLDEVLGALSVEFQPAAASLLARVARDLDVQVILVTHDIVSPDTADVVYRLSSVDGATVARKIRDGR